MALDEAVAEVDAEAGGAAQVSRPCGECGSELLPEAAFCGTCGARLQSGDGREQETALVDELAEDELEEQQVSGLVLLTQDPAVEPEPQPEPEAGRNPARRRRPLVWVGGVAATAALVALGVLALSSGVDRKAVETAATAPTTTVAERRDPETTLPAEATTTTTIEEATTTTVEQTTTTTAVPTTTPVPGPAPAPAPALAPPPTGPASISATSSCSPSCGIPRGGRFQILVTNSGGGLGQFAVKANGLQAIPSQGTVAPGQTIVVDVIDYQNKDRSGYSVEVRGPGGAVIFAATVDVR
jgi:hypothetical protein